MLCWRGEWGFYNYLFDDIILCICMTVFIIDYFHIRCMVLIYIKKKAKCGQNMIKSIVKTVKLYAFFYIFVMAVSFFFFLGGGSFLSAPRVIKCLSY